MRHSINSIIINSHCRLGFLTSLFLLALLVTSTAGAAPPPGNITTETSDRTHVVHYISAIWQDGEGDDQLVWSQPSRAFKRKIRQLHRRGFELIDVEGEQARGRRLYSGLWRQQSAPTKFFADLSQVQLTSVVRRQARRGFQPIDIEPWRDAEGRQWFDAVFAQGRGQHRLRLGLSATAFEAQHALAIDQGLKMIDLETRLSATKRRTYSAIWHSGSSEQRLGLDLDQSSFESQQQAADQKGLMLSDLEVFYVEGDTQPHFAAIWTARHGNYWLLTDGPKLVLRDRRQEHDQERSRLNLIDIEVRRAEYPGDINQPPPAHDAGSSVPTPPPDNAGG